MQVTTNTPASPPRRSDPDDAKLPFGVWTAGLVSRTLFILILTVITVHVASPQNETVWSAYETPGDLIRMVVGFLLWLVNRIPMQGTIKSIVNAVVVIFVVIWLLNVFGLMPYLQQVRVGNFHL